MKTVSEIVEDIKSSKENIESWLTGVCDQAKDTNEQYLTRLRNAYQEFNRYYGDDDNLSVIYKAIIKSKQPLLSSLISALKRISQTIATLEKHQGYLGRYYDNVIENISEILLKAIEKVSEDEFILALIELYAFPEIVSRIERKQEILLVTFEKKHKKTTLFLYKNFKKPTQEVLNLAIKHDYLECIEIVLPQYSKEVGEYISVKDLTHLQLAVDNNNPITVIALLKNEYIKQGINKQNNRGETALHRAIRNKKCDRKILQALFEAGASPFIADMFGQNVQQIILSSDSREDLELLTSYNKQLMDSGQKTKLSAWRNLKLFGHINNDYQLKGSRSEGGNLGNSAGISRDHLQAIQDKEILSNISKEDLECIKSIQDKVKQICLIQYLFDEILIIGKDDSYDDKKSKAIKDKISNLIKMVLKFLNTYGTVLIPGGWSKSSGGGHALLYEFAFQENGNTASAGGKQLLFAIFNTGAGSQYHSRHEGRKKPKFGLKLCFKIPINTSVETSIEPILLDLINIQIDSFWNSLSESYIPMDEEKLYYAVFNRVFSLGGEVLGFGSDITNLFITGQLAGTCSFKVLKAWEKFQVAKLYRSKSLEYNLSASLKLASIKWYPPESLPNNEYERFVLNDHLYYAITNFARLLQKKHKLETGSKTEDLQQEIVTFIRKVYLLVKPQLSQLFMARLQDSDKLTIDFQPKIHISRNDRYETTSIPKFEAPVLQLKKYQWDAIENFSDFFQDVNQLIDKAIKLQGDACLRLIDDMLARFPMQDKKYWQKSNYKEHNFKCLQALFKLQRIYIDNLIIDKQSKHFSYRFLTLYTIATIAGKLAENFYSNNLDGNPWEVVQDCFFKPLDEVLESQLFYVENGETLVRFELCKKQATNLSTNQSKQSLSLESIAEANKIDKEKLRKLSNAKLKEAEKKHGKDNLGVTSELFAFYAFANHMKEFNSKPLQLDVNYYTLFRLILNETHFFVSEINTPKHESAVPEFSKLKLNFEENLISIFANVFFTIGKNPHSAWGDKRLYPDIQYFASRGFSPNTYYSADNWKILDDVWQEGQCKLHPQVVVEEAEQSTFNWQAPNKLESMVTRFEFDQLESPFSLERKNGNTLQIEVLAKQKRGLRTKPKAARNLTEQTATLRHFWHSRDIEPCNIMTTVTIFLDKLDKLQDVDCQTLLTTNLFNYKATLEFVKNPSNVDAILELIGKGLSYYKDRNSFFAPISYLLKINYFLASYLFKINFEQTKQVIQAEDVKVHAESIDVSSRLKKCEEVMNQLKGYMDINDPYKHTFATDAQKIQAINLQSRLYYNLLQDIYYRCKIKAGSIDKEIVNSYFEAQFFIQTHKGGEAGKNDAFDPILEEIQQQLQYFLTPAIMKLYAEQEAKVLIENLVKLPWLSKELSEVQNSGSKAEFPYIKYKTLQGEERYIDLIRCQILREGLVLQAIPSWVYRNDRYKKLFAARFAHSNQKVWGNYQSTEIRFDCNNENYLLRQHDNALFKKIVVNNESYWFAYSEALHNCYLPKNFEYKEYVKWRLNVKINKEECTVLSEVGTLKNKFLLTKDRLFSLDENGNLSQEVLTLEQFLKNPQNNLMGFDGGFEDKSNILVFMDNGKLPTRFVYPRYGIELRAEELPENSILVTQADRKDSKDNKEFWEMLSVNHDAKSRKITGLNWGASGEFSLVPNQAFSVFPNFSDYIRLRPTQAKSQAPTLIVLPLQPFVTKGYKRISIDKTNVYLQDNLNTNSSFNVKEWNLKNQCQYLMVPLTKKGIPKPDSPEACLYLIYLYMGNRLFEQAFSQLTMFHRLGGFLGTRNEIVILHWILNEQIPYQIKNNSVKTKDLEVYREQSEAIINAPEIAALKGHLLALLIRFLAAQNKFNLTVLESEAANQDFYQRETVKFKTMLNLASLRNNILNFFSYYIRVQNNLSIEMQLNDADIYFLLMTLEPNTLSVPLLARLNKAKDNLFKYWKPPVRYANSLLNAIPSELVPIRYDYTAKKIALQFPVGENLKKLEERTKELLSGPNNYSYRHIEISHDVAKNVLYNCWIFSDSFFSCYPALLNFCSQSTVQTDSKCKQEILYILKNILKTAYALTFPKENNSFSIKVVTAYLCMKLYYTVEIPVLADKVVKEREAKSRADFNGTSSDTVTSIFGDFSKYAVQNSLVIDAPLYERQSVKKVEKHKKDVSSDLDQKLLDEEISLSLAPVKLAGPITLLHEGEKLFQKTAANDKVDIEHKSVYESIDQADYLIGRNQNRQVAWDRQQLFTELSKPHALQLFAENLDKEISRIKEKQAKTKKELLVLAQMLPKLEKERIQAELEIISGKKNSLPTTVRDLRMLYLNNRAKCYQNSTYLDQKELAEFHKKIGHFLLEESNLEHYKRCEKEVLALKVIKVLEPRHLGKLTQILQEKQSALNLQSTAVLAFESSEAKILRTKQVNILSTLVPHLGQNRLPNRFPNVVYRLNMAEGKTKVIGPMIAYLKATGMNLNILIVMQTQFNTVIRDLASTSYRAFQQNIIPFQFRRNDTIPAADLRQTFNLLLDVAVNKRTLLTVNTAFPSVELSWLTLLEQDSRDPEQAEKVAIYEGILDLIEIGDAYFDEIDNISDVHSELNFSIGAERNINTHVLHGIVDLLGCFSEIKFEYNHVAMDLECVKHGKLRDLPQEEWNKLFTNTIIEAVSNFLVDSPRSPLALLVLLFQSSQKQNLKDYLSGKANVSLPLNVLSEKQKDLIELYKQINSVLLSIVLRKKPNVGYGFSKDPTKEPMEREIAIPYKGSEESCEYSRFGSFIETIIYILLLNVHIGVSKFVLRKFISGYQTKALDQKASSFGRIESVSDTKAAKEFSELTGLPELMTIELSNEKILTEIHQKISKNASVIDYCLRNIILPNVKINAGILRHSPLDHASLYGSVQGASGTIQSPFIFDERTNFDPKFSEGTEGRMIDLLLSKNISVLPSKTESPFDAVMTTLAQNQKIKALIDVGSLFYGVSHLDVALALAKFYEDNKSIDYILFYNVNNELTAIHVVTKTEVLIGTTDHAVISKKLNVSTERCFTFYDQVRSRGTDIPQYHSAVGLVTFSGKETQFDILQGAARYRELYASQSIVVLLSYELSRLHPELEGSIEKVLSVTKMNQNIKELDNNFRAVNFKMKTKVRSNLLKCIRREVTFERKRELRQLFAEFIFTKNSDSPSQLFGKVEAEQDISTFLTAETHRLQARWKELRNLAKLPISEKEENDFSGFFLNLQRRAIVVCPKKVKSINGIQDAEVEFVAQTEHVNVEQNLQSSVEYQVDVERSAFTANARLKPEKMDFPKQLSLSDMAKALNGVAIRDLVNQINNDAHKPKFSFEGVLISALQYKVHQESSTILFDCYTKPIYYILFSQKGKNKCAAVVITPMQAPIVAKTINEAREYIEKQQHYFWIVTPHDLLFAGIRPKEVAENYFIVLEQIRYLNGNTELLARHANCLEWIFEDLDKKLEFYEKIILSCHPDRRIAYPLFKAELNRVLSDRVTRLYVEICNNLMSLNIKDGPNFFRIITEYLMTSELEKQCLLSTLERSGVELPTLRTELGPTALPNAPKQLIFSEGGMRALTASAPPIAVANKPSPPTQKFNTFSIGGLKE